MHTIQATTFELIPSKSIVRTYGTSSSSQSEDFDAAMLDYDIIVPQACSPYNSVSPECSGPPPECDDCAGEEREVRDAERWVDEQEEDVRHAIQDVEDVQDDRRAKRVQVGLGVGGLITACPADFGTGFLTPGEFACVISATALFDGTESLKNSQATLQREERDLGAARSDLAGAERRLTDAKEALDRCRRNC